VSEKVSTERLIHEDMNLPEDSFVSQSGDFEVNPSADWEPVKPVHEVLNLNRRSTCQLLFYSLTQSHRRAPAN